MTERELQTGDKVDKNKIPIVAKADYRATVPAPETEIEKRLQGFGKGWKEQNQWYKNTLCIFSLLFFCEL